MFTIMLDVSVSTIACLYELTSRVAFLSQIIVNTCNTKLCNLEIVFIDQMSSGDPNGNKHLE